MLWNHRFRDNKIFCFLDVTRMRTKLWRQTFPLNGQDLPAPMDIDFPCFEVSRAAEYAHVQLYVRMRSHWHQHGGLRRSNLLSSHFNAFAMIHKDAQSIRMYNLIYEPLARSCWSIWLTIKLPLSYTCWSSFQSQLLMVSLIYWLLVYLITCIFVLLILLKKLIDKVIYIFLYSLV